MNIRPSQWPIVRQITGTDRSARGSAARSQWSRDLTPRTAQADRVVQSICPFCAVGCGQRIFVKDDQIVQVADDREKIRNKIEGKSQIPDGQP